VALSLDLLQLDAVHSHALRRVSASVTGWQRSRAWNSTNSDGFLHSSRSMST
jgi:hypothetical protein